MSQQKTELAVAALRNGTVIDHIPCEAVYKAVRILRLEDAGTAVTIGNNLHSGKLGSKGIIKVADTEFDEATLNRIAIIAPTAVVNTIRDYEVASKRSVSLPDELVGIVRCANHKCISNHEPMQTRFSVTRSTDGDVVLRYHYCNHCVDGKDAPIL